MMDEQTARQILGNAAKDDGALDDSENYLIWHPGEDEIALDGRFTADILEAAAWWMRNKNKDSNETA